MIMLVKIKPTTTFFIFFNNFLFIFASIKKE